MQSETGESFSRSSRLIKAEHYKQVFSANFRVADDCFTLLIGTSVTSHPAIGFAIAKKQIKRAVDRNRVKRLIRESFRHRQSGLPNRHIVVMVRSKILNLTHAEIYNRLEKHWRSVIRKCEDS